MKMQIEIDAALRAQSFAEAFVAMLEAGVSDLRIGLRELENDRYMVHWRALTLNGPTMLGDCYESSLEDISLMSHRAVENMLETAKSLRSELKERPPLRDWFEQNMKF